MNFESKKLDVYERDRSPNSPLFYLTCNIINKYFPRISEDRYGARFSVLGKKIFSLYIFTGILLYILSLFYLVKNFRIDLKNSIFIIVAVLFSYPLIFAMHRGNYALHACGLASLFMAAYVGEKNRLASILLAFAIALKYYFLIFIFIFIFDKKFKELFITIFMTAFLLLGSLSFFDNGLMWNLDRLFKNVMLYNSIGQIDSIAEIVGHNNSIYMIFDIPYCVVKGILGARLHLIADLNQQIKIIPF